MTKYVGKEGGTINCPYCRGIILRDSLIHDGDGDVISFLMRCPHCQRNIFVKINRGDFIIGKEEKAD